MQTNLSRAWRLLFVGMCGLAASTVAHAERFDIVALGDTAYNGAADDRAYGALIDRINRLQPAFTIHVGDVWGSTACQESDHRRILEQFARYEQPVVYTPGDNEWTDCVDPAVLSAWERIEDKRAQPGDEQTLQAFRQVPARAARSGEWALASLARIRRLYFGTPGSLGRMAMPLLRQAAVSPRHRQMVENARWARGGVVFATVHVVGSMNGLSIASAEAAAASVQRNQANVEWIQEAFAEAARVDAKAVVLALHASMFDKAPGPGQGRGLAVRGGRHGPYALIVAAIQEQARGFGKPVLLIHGDDHEFIVDRPFLAGSGEDKPLQGANVTRLQVFGAPEIRAVRIGVDTDDPAVFSFAPLVVD